MAHRKPLGTTCKTVADWQGPLPLLHDFLVTPAATWYRIVGVEEKRNTEKVGLVLERIAAPHGSDCATAFIAEDDAVRRVHPFEWYARDRKRAVA